jgi:hypothetical protein
LSDWLLSWLSSFSTVLRQYWFHFIFINITLYIDFAFDVLTLIFLSFLSVFFIAFAGLIDYHCWRRYFQLMISAGH